MRGREAHRDTAKRLLQDVGLAASGGNSDADAIVTTLEGIGHALLALEETLQVIANQQLRP